MMEKMMWEEVMDSKEFREDLLEVVFYAISTVDPNDFEGEHEDDVAYNYLTVGMNDSGEWSFQTGDNSFTGGAYGYPHWAVVSVFEDSDPEQVCQEIISQLEDLLTHY